MNAKRWIVRGQDTNRAAALARVLGISPIVAALLISRGYDDEPSARAFLQPSYDQLHEPFLMMKLAVSRLLRAIDKGERILIYGDYDVDGKTGTAVLLRALRLLGASVGFHVPHRFTEGYGIEHLRQTPEPNAGIEMAFTIETNLWNDEMRMQLNVADLPVVSGQ